MTDDEYAYLEKRVEAQLSGMSERIIKPAVNWKLSKDQLRAICGQCRTTLGRLDLRDGEGVVVLVDGYVPLREYPHVFVPSKRLVGYFRRLQQRAKDPLQHDTVARERLSAGAYGMGDKHRTDETRRTIRRAELGTVVVECLNCGTRNGRRSE